MSEHLSSFEPDLEVGYKSLRTRLIWKFLSVIISMMVVIILVVGSIFGLTISRQLQGNVTISARHGLGDVKVIKDRSVLLVHRFSQNHFIINSLTDSEGRGSYLPKMVDDFSNAKGLNSVSIVDFEGNLIYSSQPERQNYAEDIQLWSSLQTGKSHALVSRDFKTISIIEPIEYYDTPQGAVIAEYDFISMLKEGFLEADVNFYRIFFDKNLILSYRDKSGKSYIEFEYIPERMMLSSLGVSGIRIELGISKSAFWKPIWKVFIQVGILGLLFLIISIIIAIRIGNRLVEPILELCEKVTRQGTSEVIVCSPTGTGDELEILAQVLDRMQLQIIERSLDLEEKNHHLAREVDERIQMSEFLRHAKEKAENADKAKSEFLATMSHEIRTPMNAVLGGTQIVLEMDLPPKANKFLAMVDNSSKSLMRIIDDILDFSKMEAGKVDLDSVDFQLGDVFDQLKLLFRDQMAKKGLELIMEIYANCPHALHGDYLRIEQILVNLLGNSIKFTETGFVFVRVEAVEQTDGQWMFEFSVQDTGIGLEEEQIDRIFSPFVQADGSTTRKYGGTGLGLSICKRLIEVMEGKIWVESTLGQGSIFHFSIIIGKQLGAEKAEPIPPSSIQGLDVLVVDDNGSAQKTIQEYLRSFTFKSSIVISGQEALEAIRRAIKESMPYQLIVLDYEMPDMDGIETANKIGEIILHEFPDVAPPKIILLSAFQEENDLENLAKQAGVDACLSKPVDRSFLFDSIMGLLGQEIAKRYTRRRFVKIDYDKVTDIIGGTHLLLVEDVSINQQVACELLEGVGIHVDIANDGAEAVRMVESCDYDVVLMDIQMPVMNGYEATRTIRKNPRFAQLPIIAMTAHAMAGDREKCLVVGMDDHVSKPILAERLFSTLVSHVKPGDRRPIDRESLCKKQIRMIDEKVVFKEIPGIDMESALRRVMGDKALLIKLLVEFRCDYVSVADKVQKAFAAGKSEQAKKTVHQIKGVSGNLGMIQLNKAAYNLDLAIKQERKDEWPNLVKKFSSALDEILIVTAGLQATTDEKDIERDLSRETGVLEHTPDLEVLRSGLIQLALNLKEFKLDSNVSFTAIKPALLQIGKREEIEAMEEKIGSFDFVGARTLLESVSQTLNISLDTKS